MNTIKGSCIIISLLILLLIPISSNYFSVIANFYHLDEGNNPTQIDIDGNAEFIITASQQGWPGDGTESSPIQIKDLNIDFSFELQIHNTNLHFQFTDNTIITDEKNSNIYFALFLDNVSNAEFSKNQITGFLNDPGVIVQDSQDINILDNVLSFGGGGGIFLFNSSKILVKNNFISNQDQSIDLYDSKNISITENSFQHHILGLCFAGDIETVQITNNDFVNSSIDMDSYINLPYGFGVNITGNTVNGKILLLWRNQSNKLVPDNVGQVILINSSNIEVSNQHFSLLNYGIFAYQSSYLQIQQNGFYKINEAAIKLESTNLSVITNNNIYDNEGSGFYSIGDSHNNSITSNNITLNKAGGIRISRSEKFLISNNKIDQNSGTGISVYCSHKDKIESNLVTQNKYNGIY
ncbi:MAG: right-handed parallel beta-helix repeat-containing protein, partial [Candidatus Thorarchaeota archaeon]